MSNQFKIGPAKSQNYFDILGLKPPATKKSVLAAIAEKSSNWNLPVANAAVSYRNMEYLKILPNIKRVMLNPTDRRKEADKWNTGQVVEYSSTDKIYGIE